ncbi:TaqI-like C-terminal specificity domain-containing protein, partial [Bacteroides caccae]
QACLVQDSNGLNNLSDFVQQQGVKCNFADSIPWVILSPIEQSIRRKIESIGTPLKDWDINIYRGVLTGYNDAFIISTEKRDEILANCQTEGERVRTAELIRPILRGRDIKRYGYDWAGQWLIYIPWHFPYQFDESITGASEKAEKAFKEQYPAVYNHMLEYKEPLSKRNKAETGIRYEWYAMQQRWGAKYWEDFSKPKIIWGEISDKSKFAFDFLGEYIPEATSFYMKGECIEYLLSALNSSVSEWLFSKVGTTTGVGTIRWKKYTIEQLIVAKLSTEQLNTHLAAFNDLKVGKMSITDFECFSNKLMYDVYKLTSDEIQYIENQQIV